MRKINDVKFLIIANILLCLFLIFTILFTVIPCIWRESDNTSISQITESGNMQSATLKTFEPIFTFSKALSISDNALNRAYITDELSGVSSDYLRTYGLDTDISVKKVCVSPDSFCYMISGADNGEVWEVWVVSGSSADTLVHVYRQEA